MCLTTGLRPDGPGLCPGPGPGPGPGRGRARGPGPGRAGAGAGPGPGFFDFLWGPGRAIFGSASKFAARGANRRVIWSREGSNQAVFENRYNLCQARKTLRHRTRLWAPGNGAQPFPQEKSAWEKRGLEPRGLCVSEIL